jgi:mannitol/fructose-specific phosphotransferase system IIA component (Ntr-type)
MKKIQWHIFVNTNLHYPNGQSRIDKFDQCITGLFFYSLSLIEKQKIHFNIQEAVNSLLIREKLGSTAGGNLAVPHAEIKSLKDYGIISACHFHPGIYWPSAKDECRVMMVFYALFPENISPNHMKILAIIFRNFKKFLGRNVSSEEFITTLINAFQNETYVTVNISANKTNAADNKNYVP